MIIPVRCFTCGAITGNKWERYEELLKQGIEPKDIYVILNLKRYCCKRIFLTHVNMIDQLILYKPLPRNIK